MKIAIVIVGNSTGGAEKQVRALSKYLNDSGHYSELIFLRHDSTKINHEKELKTKNTQFHFPTKKISLSYIGWIFKLSRYLRNQKYDLIHSFLPEPTVIISIYKSIFQRDCIHISGVRGSYFKKIGYGEKMYIHSLRKSNAVTCNSDSLKAVCISDYGLPSSRVIMIPNGVEVNEAHEKVFSFPMKAVVVANLHPYKGYDLLFDSLKSIELPLELHIVGRGNFQELYEFVNSTIPPYIKICFRGEVDISREYATFDFAIHPSRTEGMSNAIMEELSNGLPVIAFDVGGNSQLIQNNWNGFLIDELSSLKLANAINMLNSNYRLLEILSKNAVISMSEFRFDILAEKHIKLYLSLLKKTREI